MKYKVLIRNNETKEERIQDMGAIEWDADNSIYWWTDGNFGCDCNREWEFERAGGYVISPDPKCGHHRFTVPWVELESGERIPIDEGWVDVLL